MNAEIRSGHDEKEWLQAGFICSRRRTGGLFRRKPLLRKPSFENLRKTGGSSGAQCLSASITPEHNKI